MIAQAISLIQNIDLYETRGFNAVAQKCLLNPFFWQEMETLRLGGLDSWLKSVQSLRGLREEVIRAFDPIFFQGIEFQLFRGQPTPLLKKSMVFDKELKGSALITLKQLLQNQGKKEKLISALNNSTQLDNRDVCFRTYQLKGQPYIFGNDLPLFSSVTGLAHELGHLIVETNTFSETPTSRHSLLGECLAHCLEELAGRALSTSKDEQDLWCRYCSWVDQINYYFFLFEVGDLPNELLDFFCPQSLPLRQTLYCSPGFQVNYAAASIVRARCRASWQ